MSNTDVNQYEIKYKSECAKFLSEGIITEQDIAAHPPKWEDLEELRNNTNGINMIDIRNRFSINHK